MKQYILDTINPTQKMEIYFPFKKKINLFQTRPCAFDIYREILAYLDISDVSKDDG